MKHKRPHLKLGEVKSGRGVGSGLGLRFPQSLPCSNPSSTLATCIPAACDLNTPSSLKFLWLL